MGRTARVLYAGSAMRRLAAHLALGLIAALGGCAGPTGSVPTRVVAEASPEPARGGSWAAVMPGPVVAGLLDERSDLEWTESRRTDSLSPRAIEPLLASNAWPEPKRPTLERPRFIRIIRSPNGFIHYRREWRFEYYRRWW